MTVADASGKHPPHPGMVWITGGTFRMGSDKHYPEEAPVHRVTVDGFWMDPTPARRHDSAILVAERENGNRCPHPSANHFVRNGVDDQTSRTQSGMAWQRPAPPSYMTGEERWFQRRKSEKSGFEEVYPMTSYRIYLRV